MPSTRRLFLASLASPLLAAGETGFVSLFNGRDLDGWQVVDGPESAFYADNGDLVVHTGSNFPTWLRTEKEYENFDFECEFFMKGWINSGIFLHAPLHGNPTDAGMQVNLFHKIDNPPLAESIGAIFPVAAPIRADVHRTGEWNRLRIRTEWPSLQVWINGQMVQDLNVEGVPELRHRLRKGFLGIESLSYPIRYRNLRIKELPGTEAWESLWEGPADWDKWFVAEGDEKYWERLGPILRSDGLGYLATKALYKDFEFQSYIRHVKQCNGGILFRADKDPKSERRYEIQIHDVWGATYPTGSLYHFRRSVYPRTEPEKWFLFQLVVTGDECLVRIDGQTVMDYQGLENRDPGHILLQAHRRGFWIEYKQMRVRSL